MKVSNIPTVLLSASFSVAVSVASLGEVSSENGKVFDGESYMVAERDMKKREQIKPHDYPGFKTLIFTVGKGNFDVTLNQTGKRIVGAGSVLRFGGDAVIETVATEDVDIVIALIK